MCYGLRHKERMDRLNARLAEAEKQHLQEQQQMQQQIYALRRETEELQRQQRQQQQATEEIKQERDLEIEKRDSLAQQLFLMQQRAAVQTADRACQATAVTDVATSQVDPLVLQYLRDSEQQLQRQTGLLQHDEDIYTQTAAAATAATGRAIAATDRIGRRPLFGGDTPQGLRRISAATQQQEQQQGEEETLLPGDMEQQQADLSLRIKNLAARANAKPYAFQRAAATAGDAASPAPASATPVPPASQVTTGTEETHTRPPVSSKLILKQSAGFAAAATAAKGSRSSSSSSSSSDSTQQAAAPLPLFRMEETEHQRHFSGSSLCSFLSSSRAASAAAAAATATAAAAEGSSPPSPLSLLSRGSRLSPSSLLARRESRGSDKARDVGYEKPAARHCGSFSSAVSLLSYVESLSALLC